MASRHSPIGAVDGFYIADPATGIPLSDKNTYLVVATMAPAATPTDVLEIVGAANKTIEILQIDVTGVIGTSNGIPMDLIKRSTANTGGSSTNATIVPASSADPASSATVKQYTANPSLGTAVGTVKSYNFTILSATSTTHRLINSFISNNEPFQPLTLLAANETLCVNLKGVATPPTSLTFTIRFAEYTTYRGT